MTSQKVYWDANPPYSALVAKAESLHTFDEDLLKLNGRISSLRITKLSLQQP